MISRSKISILDIVQRIPPIPRILLMIGTVLFISIWKGSVSLVLVALFWSILCFFLRDRVYQLAIATVTLPFAIILVILYSFILRAPPDMPIGSDQIGGFSYSILVFCRIQILFSTIFFLFGKLNLENYQYFFHKLRIRSSFYLVFISSMIVSKDALKRSGDIVESRFARGLCPKRSPVYYFQQLIPTIGTLFSSLLITAIERNECWNRENTPKLAEIRVAMLVNSVRDPEPILFTVLLWIVVILYLGLSFSGLFYPILIS